MIMIDDKISQLEGSIIMDDRVIYACSAPIKTHISATAKIVIG